jgi:hypothetical protein
LFLSRSALHTARNARAIRQKPRYADLHEDGARPRELGDRGRPAGQALAAVELA